MCGVIPLAESKVADGVKLKSLVKVSRESDDAAEVGKENENDESLGLWYAQVRRVQTASNNTCVTFQLTTLINPKIVFNIL